jgi:hypothetical protein
VTDRVRVLVGAVALVVLPWAGRRRGWFGPVRGSFTARLVRVAGSVAVCGLGVAVVRMDSHLGLGPHGPGPFSLPREIIALVLVGAALAALAVVKARWPDADPGVLWAIAAIAGLLVFFAVPLQALAVVYVAAILAATSRRSPVTNASLAAGAIAGLAVGLATSLAAYELTTVDDRYAGLWSLAWSPCCSCSPPSLAWRRPGCCQAPGTRRSCGRRGAGRERSPARWPELSAACCSPTSSWWPCS